MSFKDLTLKKMYRSKKCNIINEFFVPVLNESVEYKRAVGFFSSSALYQLAEGISGLVKNGGKIRIIASPRLTAEDALAIKEGYDLREIVEKRILEDFEAPKNQRKKNQLNMLANLIADGKLDIKIAFMKDDELYHEKLGIARDLYGNLIAINGSINETGSAMSKNFESFDVFNNWSNEENVERTQLIADSFNNLWHDLDDCVDVIPFPKLAVKKFEKYKEYPMEQVIQFEETYKNKTNENPLFRAPENIDFYDYQEEAVSNWMDNNAVGIFDMATGSGKTYTGLYALSELSLKLQDQLAVVIVVPYQHLVEQWVEDINNFGVEPIVAYSSYPKWKEKFDDAVNAYNVKVKRNFCIITTTSTFSTEKFQSILGRIKKNLCFVADEAHNLGAKRISLLLPENAKYRLALSATIERHRDEQGTQVLRNYFGETCQSFTLKDAIDRGFLTEYYYYPIVVNLNSEELEQFIDISHKIIKLGGASQENCESNPTIERLLLQRARIVAGAHNKVEKLLEAIKPYQTDSHILVYCGATKYDRNDIDDESQVKQITEVTKKLYEKYGFKVRKFTSDENKYERQEIKQMFAEGKDLQVITAIKCLDEGVNIPAIKTAFIMASSTNPKEYIQRRGRVLRKFDGKAYAEIYDFITIPRPLEDISCVDSNERKIELGLVKKELVRMMDFAETANNPKDTDELRETLLDSYGAYNIDWSDLDE